VELVVKERKSYPETLVCLSQTLFIVRNDAMSCQRKYFARIVSLYWKVSCIFFVDICIESSI